MDRANLKSISSWAGHSAVMWWYKAQWSCYPTFYVVLPLHRAPLLGMGNDCAHNLYYVSLPGVRYLKTVNQRKRNRASSFLVPLHAVVDGIVGSGWFYHYSLLERGREATGRLVGANGPAGCYWLSDFILYRYRMMLHVLQAAFFLGILQLFPVMCVLRVITST